MLFAFPFVFVGILSVGQDPAGWPGLLGPRGDLRASPTQKIMVPWPASGLTREWSYPLGEGYAAPVSAMGKVYAFHRIDKNEIVDAIDAATGRKLWSTPWVMWPVVGLSKIHRPIVLALSGCRVFSRFVCARYSPHLWAPDLHNACQWSNSNAGLRYCFMHWPAPCFIAVCRRFDAIEVG